MREISVDLGERSYPIFFAAGLLDQVGVDLHSRGVAKRYFILSDSHVTKLYGDRLQFSLREAGLQSEMLTFPAGEASKNLSTIATLSSKLAQMGADRKDGLIALGGGVTGDITGFLAAVYMRGIPFVQIPTTLLAQVDSSVGGKTGVDIPEGKNLVGAFYQPHCVYIDSEVLKTLPHVELLNGLAEIIKYSIIYDKAFFRFLKEKRDAVLSLDLSVLEEIICRCCAIKAEVVAADEKESGLRRILNFGHTIGHAVEACSDFTLPHGLAVAIGMGAACTIAAEKGLITKNDAAAVQNLISAYGLPLQIPSSYEPSRIKEYVKRDKKTVGGKPFFVLPTEIGKVTITSDVSEDLIDKVILEAKE